MKYLNAAVRYVQTKRKKRVENHGRKGSMFLTPFPTRYSRHFSHEIPLLAVNQNHSGGGAVHFDPGREHFLMVFRTFIIDVLPEDPLRAKERRLAGRRKKHSERESRARFFAFQLTNDLITGPLISRAGEVTFTFALGTEI